MTALLEHKPVEDTRPYAAVACMGDVYPEGTPCYDGEPQAISEENYTRQMMSPDALWKCPTCRGNAKFCDDDNLYKCNTPEGWLAKVVPCVECGKEHSVGGANQKDLEDATKVPCYTCQYSK